MGQVIKAKKHGTPCTGSDQTAIGGTRLPRVWVRDGIFPSYNLPLLSTLVPTKGAVTPLFSRSTTGTVVDFEGAVHEAVINEARFAGARRVENLLDASEDFSGWARDGGTATDTYGAIAPDGTPTATILTATSDDVFVQQAELSVAEIGREYAIACWIRRKTGTGQIRFDGRSGVQDITSAIADGLWHYFDKTSAQVLTTEFFAFRIDISGDEIEVWHPMWEKVSGTQTSASEYVSTGVSVQAGPEKVVDGGFDGDGSDWQVAAGWIIENGHAQFTANGTNSTIGQSYGATLGKTYTIKYTVIQNSLNDGLLGLSSASIFGSDTLNSEVGTHKVQLKAVNPGPVLDLYIYVGGINTSGTIQLDNISVREEYYHGANVDGVRYFTTDRDGAAIPDADLLGIMNEPQGTNLITYSEDFSQVDWSKNNLFVDSNQVLAPDGTLTADKLKEDATSLEKFIFEFVAVTDGNTYTLSILAKPDEHTIFQLVGVIPGFGTDVWTNFDMTGNGSIGYEGAGVISSSIEKIGDYYKCSVTALAVATGNGGTMIALVDNTNTNTRRLAYTGDEISGIYIWGAQAEQSPFPTSYIKTEATTVTRTADSLTVDNTARDVLPNSFCLAGTWIPLGAGADYDTNLRLFGSQDSRGINNEQRTSGSILNNYIPIAAGGGEVQLLKSDINQLIPNKYAIQLFQDGSNVNAKIYKDGVQKLSEVETQTLDHSNLTLEIGSWTGTVFASTIRDIKIYKKELSDSRLAGLTT